MEWMEPAAYASSAPAERNLTKATRGRLTIRAQVGSFLRNIAGGEPACIAFATCRLETSHPIPQDCPEAARIAKRRLSESDIVPCGREANA